MIGKSIINKKEKVKKQLNDPNILQSPKLSQAL